MIKIKCSKCNKIWQSSFSHSRMQVCPFCGNEEEGANDETSIIISSLKTIVEKYGVDILKDGRRANAFLMDYIPKFQKERKLIASALNEGIGEILINAAGGSIDIQHQAVTKSIKCLISDLWIAEEAAAAAVNIIAAVLGYETEGKIEITANSKISENRYESGSDNISARNIEKKELIKGDYHEDDDLEYCIISNKYSIIGYKALSSMKAAETVTIPEGVRIIKSRAFMNCLNLKTVNLPSSLEAIGTHVFAGCINLESINLKNNNNYCVSGNMLIDRKQKKLLRAENRNEDRIRIPEGIRYVSGKAFERNTVTEIILPVSLTDISGDAFYECYKLQSFRISQKNRAYCEIEGVLHTGDGRTLLKFPIDKHDVSYYLEDKVEYIAERAFSKAVNLVSITFNSCIKKIGKGAFEYCSSLETIILPGSIQEIGERAFQYCDCLKNIMLSRNITEIGDFAFCECKNLKTINIPGRVEKIGNSAFCGCKQLASVIVQENVKKIGDRAFDGCSPDLIVKIKNNPYIEEYCKAHRINFELI